MPIRLIKRADLELPRYNGCVHYAINTHISGYAWYLDTVAREWDALVEDNYESVLPLIPGKSRWGRPVIQHPNTMPPLGIFSVNMMTPRRVNAFFDAIPKVYKKGDFLFQRKLNKWPEGVTSTPVENYELSLQPSFEQLEQQFSPELLAAQQKARAAGLIADGNLKPETIADFYEKYGPKVRKAHLREQRKHAQLRVMYNALHRGLGMATGVRHPDGQLLAANFLLFGQHRMSLLNPAASPEGEALGALAMSWEVLLKSQAGKPLWLDFNGQLPAQAVSLNAVRSDWAFLSWKRAPASRH